MGTVRRWAESVPAAKAIALATVLAVAAVVAILVGTRTGGPAVRPVGQRPASGSAATATSTSRAARGVPAATRPASPRPPSLGRSSAAHSAPVGPHASAASHASAGSHTSAAQAPGKRGTAHPPAPSLGVLATAAARGTLHFTSNDNFSAAGVYLPRRYGFDLADVGSLDQLKSLPAGVRGLVWVGLCGGADPEFVSTVKPYAGSPKLFGFYLYDEPDPTGRWSTKCPQSNLKAESDYVHAHLRGAKTFIIAMNLSASTSPSYRGTYNPSNSHIDLYGLDPYPCRVELHGCDYSYIPKAVAAAKSAGIPASAIVPVFQSFGLGSWIDDGESHYAMPTAAQENVILSRWQSVLPRPVFDYAYSWGSQNGDVSLSGSASLRSVFAAHNRTG